MTVTDIQNAYIARYQANRDARQAVENRITQRQEQIVRLEKKRSRLWNESPHWTEDLLRPLLDALKAVFPQYYFDDERLTTFGLRAACPVGIYNRPDFNDRELAWEDRGCVAYLTFVPGTMENGEIYMETGRLRSDRTFAPNTLGDVNGMNNETVLITSLEQVIARIQEQLDRPD